MSVLCQGYAFTVMVYILLIQYVHGVYGAKRRHSTQSQHTTQTPITLTMKNLALVRGYVQKSFSKLYKRLPTIQDQQNNPITILFGVLNGNSKFRDILIVYDER
jgi:hypothetical protein